MKFLVALLFFGIFGAAMSDAPQVTERMSCADISARITELSAIEEPDEDTVAEVTKLKADYRRSCARNAAGRRTSGGVRVITETVTEDVVAEEEIIPAEPEEQATQPDPVVETDENVDSEITLEQELANLDAGLCADGSQPNRFGCCGDEIFKDLGNTVFACCPKGGGDCFPPLK